MYKALGGAASVNPYSANFSTDAVKSNKDGSTKSPSPRKEASDVSRRSSLRVATRTSLGGRRGNSTTDVSPSGSSNASAVSTPSKKADSGGGNNGRVSARQSSGRRKGEKKISSGFVIGGGLYKEQNSLCPI